MKKLMFGVAAAALCGAVSATPIFDYKASVKYVDFKQVKGNNDSTLALKVVKSASIKGYLVTPVDCPCVWMDEAGVAGVPPSFLVVQNAAAKKYNKTTSFVKLLPANLLAEYWATKDLSNVKKASLQAQGYLFAGLTDQDVPADKDHPIPTGSPFYTFGDKDTAATKYLFGAWNMEDFLADPDTGIVTGKFIEPWVNHAGFGKAEFYADREYMADKGFGCAPNIFGTEEGGACLISLSGSVIGGSWACAKNIYGEQWRCQGWNYADMYMYNVISGTWSIKANAKFYAKCLDDVGNIRRADFGTWNHTGVTAPQFTKVTLDEASLVQYCGANIDRNFKLYTFDDEKLYKPVYKLDPTTGTYVFDKYESANSDFNGKFVAKWMY